VKVTNGIFVALVCFFFLSLAATEGYSYTITSSAGVGGLISPSGEVPVAEGSDVTFAVSPNLGYEILDVATSSGSLGPVPSYTFTDVTADDFITASFSACSDPSPVLLLDGGLFDNITAATGAASPSGLNTIMLRAGTLYNEDVHFAGTASISLKGGYNCAFNNDYTFTSIPGSLTISASSGPVTVSNVKLIPKPFCQPGDPNNFPGNTEICDGKDNDCDGQIDEGLTFDVDGDGYTSIGSCEGSHDDCNDNNSSIHPNAAEICDGIDQNCDGQIDEGLTFDVDGDGYTSSSSCTGSRDDCDDLDGSVHPGAVEITADGIDQNCDGLDFASIGSVPCSECHAYLNFIDVHSNKVATPDGTCIECHVLTVGNVLNGHLGRTVRTAGNNMSAGSIIECTSCHDVDHDFYQGTNAQVVWPKVAAVGMGNETCDTCHESRAAGHATSTAHNNRLIENACGQCHTSDTTKLGFPGTGSLTNAADVDTLHRSDCTLCHSYTGTKLDRAVVRQEIQYGLNGTPIPCTACHNYNPAEIHPFVLDHHTNIVTTEGTSCGSCHTSSSLVDAADPKVHNGCSTCHDATGNLINLAAGKSAPGNCTTCHGADFVAIHPATIDHTAIVTVGSTVCGSCHRDPLPLVDPNDPKVHSACSNCHDADGNLINLAEGKSFIPGGDCTTCHGDYFPSHSHHTGVNNQVSYDAEVDTSQTSRQGCAVCHHDYDTANGTSLGLDTWLTILVEHDLDDTKDGSANTCANCHFYNGGSSPPLEAVQGAIAGSDPVTCATCHTDKVPNVSHGIPTSGKHTEHFVMAGVSCETCHNIWYFPYFKSGTDGNGDGLFDLTETDVCNTCHQDGSGNPAADDFKSGWADPNFVLDCTSCHGLPPHTGTHVAHISGVADVWSSKEITFATSAYLTDSVPESTLFLRLVIDSSFVDFWDKQRALSPKKVRFSDGTNLIDYSVESWDAANEEAVFILAQPALSGSSDFNIYIHYGVTATAEDDAGDSVFPSEVIAYYPLDANNPGGYLDNMADATGGTDLVEYSGGNPTTDVSGYGGGRARHFTNAASTQGLTKRNAYNGDLNAYNAKIGVFASTYYNSYSDLDMVAVASGSGGWSWYLCKTGTSHIINGGTYDEFNNVMLTGYNAQMYTGIWYRNVFYQNGDGIYQNQNSYQDGVDTLASKSGAWVGTYRDIGTNNSLGIGYDGGDDSNAFENGNIDNLLITKGLTVTDDIATLDHQNQTQTWVSFGAQGNLPPPGAPPIPEITLQYGDLRTTADFMAGEPFTYNMIACGNCHPLDPSFHGNGVWGDVELSNANAPAGSLKSLSPNGSYEMTTGTCSNVYCHSANSWTTDGNVPMPWPEATGWNKDIDPLPRPLPDNIITERVYKDVTWNSGQTLTCNGCHDSPPQTTALDNDGGAGDSHSWIDPYGYESLHAWNMGFDAIGCRTCHYDTVREASQVEYDYPAPYRRSYHDVPLYDKAKHVNGSVDVAFDTADNFTYNSSYYLTHTTYDLSTATFDPATKTCSNVGCHFQQTSVTWGLPYRWYELDVECDRCHGYYNVDGSCYNCH